MYQKKKCCLVCLLFVVGKVFEKRVNNRLVDHLEKCGLFSDLQYGFRSSQTTASLLTVVSHRTARACLRGGGGGSGEGGATQVVALDTSMAFNRVWRAGKLKSYGISGLIFHLFFLLLVMCNFQWFWMAIIHRNIELMLEFIRFHSWSYYTLMTFLMMLSIILLLSTLMILHSKCDQAYDLWQQLVLASELESDLRDTVDCGRR